MPKTWQEFADEALTACRDASAATRATVLAQVSAAISLARIAEILGAIWDESKEQHEAIEAWTVTEKKKGS